MEKALTIIFGLDNKKSAQSAFVPRFSVSVSNTNNFTSQVQTLSSGIATKRTSASGAISTYEYIKK